RAGVGSTTGLAVALAVWAVIGERDLGRMGGAIAFAAGTSCKGTLVAGQVGSAEYLHNPEIGGTDGFLRSNWLRLIAAVIPYLAVQVAGSYFAAFSGPHDVTLSTRANPSDLATAVFLFLIAVGAFARTPDAVPGGSIGAC
ncbi:MAG: hypothetical protein ACREFY_08220, partial [Acetobacteraceae bacterium]